MSTRTEELGALAKEMRGANSRNIEFIESGIIIRGNLNEELAKGKESRQTTLYDNMFVQVDEIGLSKLIYSFSDSYERSSDRTILNAIVDTNNPIPHSMTERFLRDLPEVPRSDTRWFVGANRWGGLIGSHSGATSDLRKHYNAVTFAIRKILEAVERHRGTLEGFAIASTVSRHYTSSTEFASSAFISRLNYVSDDAIDVFVGIDGRKAQPDGIVASVRNMLGALEKNIGIAKARGEELADQAESLVSDTEAFDPQFKDSEVELVIYRPDLLADGRGLENARADQHEYRYSALKSNLTANLYEVADFIARPTGSLGSTIATLCVDAIRAIKEWEVFIEGGVSVEIREAYDPSIPDSFRQWGSRQNQHRSLEDYLTGSVVEDIAAAKAVLNEWEAAFSITENYARDFTVAVNNDSHVSGLSVRVEQAIYPPDAFQDLQTFANEVKSGLEEQADAYNDFAGFIRKNMKDVAETGYADALQQGANYFQAIAQTIETDFWGAGFSGEVDKTSLFEVRNITMDGDFMV